MAHRKPGAARHIARKMTVQALYQHQINGDGDLAMIKQFMDHPEVKNCDLEYFRENLSAILASKTELEDLMTPSFDRDPEQVDPIAWAILYLGVHELSQRLDVPYRVVINEAIELAKMFGADQSHKYINGILDRLAPTLRAVEVQAHAAKR